MLLNKSVFRIFPIHPSLSHFKLLLVRLSHHPRSHSQHQYSLPPLSGRSDPATPASSLRSAWLLLLISLDLLAAEYSSRTFDPSTLCCLSQAGLRGRGVVASQQFPPGTTSLSKRTRMCALYLYLIGLRIYTAHPKYSRPNFR